MILQDDIHGRIKLAQVISDQMQIPRWFYEDRELVWALGEINKLCSLQETFEATVKGFFSSLIANNSRLPFNQKIENKVTYYRIIEFMKKNKEFRERIYAHFTNQKRR